MNLFFVIFTSVICNSHAFNLETRIPIIKNGPKGSYFGYSVAEHQSIDDVSRKIRQNWLLVGAPIGENLQPGTNRSGALWRCPITTRSDDCSQVVTDGKRRSGKYYKSVDSVNLLPPLDDELKDGQWMGVTVRSQKPGGKVLVCAHRYIRSGPNYQWGQGLCYTLTQDLDYDETWEPCKGRPVAREHEEYGYCQAGTSGLLLDDDTAVIGTPGLYTWRGTVFVVSVSDDYLHREKTPYFGPHVENSPVDKYSYLGMAVTGAQFFSKANSYAAGAPRANGTGQVVLFSKIDRKNPMNVHLIIPGEQFASSFGYEVAAADLNGDGLPELIVGAPFYFDREAGGAVYIYYNNKERCLTCNPPQKLTGTLESRFGFAIANLGDLNQDGFQDLAIGAPYEEDGVVYIFLGSADGLLKEPSQVIRGEQIRSHPATFGYSLSGGVDLDGNGHPDLLVGAYDVDQVVLLRARPIIDITTEVTPESALRNIDPTQRGCSRDLTSEYTCFSFKTCCTVNMNVTADELMVHYRIEAETFQQGRKFSRVWFGSDNVSRPSSNERPVVLTRQNHLSPLKNCQDHIVYLKENTKDIQSPIKMKLSYKLVQKDPQNPRPGSPLPDLHPILNQQEAAKIIDATFQKDCGEDDICQSDLSTSYSLSIPPGDGEVHGALHLGAVDDLRINVTIENNGESAYETLFFVFHPATVSYNRIDSESKQVFCQSHNKTVVACQVGNPLKNGGQMKFQVKFDVKQVGDQETMLNFIIFSNTTSQEQRGADIPQNILIAVVKKAEVSLKGSARPEQVFYGGAVRGESAMLFKDDIGTRVVHTYAAYNAGPWRVRDLEVEISWPFQVANNRNQGKWLLYLDETPTVDAYGGGQCYVPSEAVNPLGLGSRPGFYETPTSPSPSTTDNYTETIVSLDGGLRRKRELRIRSERVFDAEGRAHNVVNMNCINGTAKCLKFKCLVYSLQGGQTASIRVSGRLWNSTLVEDYSRVSYVTVTSRAELNMGRQPLIQNRADDIADVTTKAYPELLDGVSTDSVPLWIVVVAAVAGILFLLLIVLVCWKIGFFKRNRPDPTLSGNLLKSGQNTSD